MSAINFSYNSELCFTSIIDNTIVLKNIINDKVIYKLPIPKNFQIVGVSYHYGENRPTYIIAPFMLKEPEFIPNDFNNLHLGVDGTWHATKKVGESSIDMAYFDTTILTDKDFEYITLGKYQVKEENIPDPFWIPNFNDIYIGWANKNDIQNVVEAFDKKSRLITEDELLSVFAFNEFGMHFWEHLPEDIYNLSFFSDVKHFILGVNCFELDNWDIVVSSRENRNVYKLIYRESTRLFNEKYWYRSRSFIYDDDIKKSFHIFPVISEKTYKKDKTN